MILLMLVVFTAVLLIGAPIFLCLGAASLTPYLSAPYILGKSFPAGGDFLTRLMLQGVNSLVLLAIPMFVLAGVIMGVGGISRKIFDVFVLIVGRRPAGIPCAVVLTSIIYGSITGAGAPATAAVGSMAIPIMIKLGYDKRFAASLVAAGGGMGLILPPSLGYVLFGSLTGTSIGALFVAGFIPGLLISLVLMIYVLIYCRFISVDMTKIEENYNSVRSRGVWTVLKDSFWALLSPVVILGCIYGGLTTPTEAAVISVWYSLIVCVFIYKTVKLKELLTLLREAVSQYAGIAIVIAFGTGVSRVFTLLNMPREIGAFLTSTFPSSESMLLAIIVVLSIIGMFMDLMPCLIIFSPLLHPILVGQLGVNAVHFGIIMTATVALGLITPPYGLNMFIAAGIAKVDPGKLFKQSIAVSICYIVGLMFITYIPQISTYLPKLLGYIM